MITLQAVIDQELIDIIAKIRAFQQDYPLSVLFPAAASAVQEGAAAIQEQWKAYASGEVLPSGDRVKNPTGGYAASITMNRQTLWAYRISSGADVARWLEDGTPEVDFKETHPYGTRGRVAKKKVKGSPGVFRYVPYIIIPFRWATPGHGAHMGAKNVIPDQVFAKLRAGIKKGTFQRSVVLDGKTASPNFWGEAQSRNTYEWGDRVKGVGGNVEGLAAMKGAPDKKGVARSSYFTFRVISADSPAGSWIKPATKALRIAEQTAQFMSDKVSKLVEAGFYEDLKGMSL